MFWFQLFLLFALVLSLSFAYATLKGAPYVPMRRFDVARLIEVADIQEGDVFYDLGCGDGRILEAAAYEGAKSIGYELATLPYLYSLWRARRVSKYDAGSIEVFYKDFWKANLTDADIVYAFQLPRINEEMKSKFENELRDGAKVITYVFRFKGWKPVRVQKEKDKGTIYVYEIGKSNIA